MSCLILDFDGVLADTFWPMVEFTAKKAHISESKALAEIVRYTLRNRKEGWLRQRIKDRQSFNFSNYIRQKYPQKLANRELLEIIRALPCRKAILTNSYIFLCQEILGPDMEMFEFVSSTEDGGTKTARLGPLLQKLNCKKEECLFVTDTVGDVLELERLVKKEQIYASAWGFNSWSMLKKVLPEEQILHRFSELTSAAKNFWPENEEIQKLV